MVFDGTFSYIELLYFPIKSKAIVFAFSYNNFKYEVALFSFQQHSL